MNGDIIVKVWEPSEDGPILDFAILRAITKEHAMIQVGPSPEESCWVVHLDTGAISRFTEVSNLYLAAGELKRLRRIWHDAKRDEGEEP